MAEPVAKLAEPGHRCRAQQAIDELAGALESIGEVAIRAVRAHYVVHHHEAGGDHDVHGETERSVPPDGCDLVLRDRACGSSRAECVPWLDQCGQLELVCTMGAHHHHVVVGRGDAFSALQRNLNEVNHGRLMICHEDDRLRGNCSVLVGRQDVVPALDLLDRSGFTRRILALDDLHERAGDEAVAFLFLLFLFASSILSCFSQFIWLSGTWVFTVGIIGACGTSLILGCNF